MISNLNSQISKWIKSPILPLLVIWAIVQFVLFQSIGINDKFEAIRYLQNGARILEQQEIIAFHLFYSFYSLLIAINLFITKSLVPIILFQLGLNAFATVLFYKIVRYLTTNIIAIGTSLLLILFFPIQQWNFHVYTESVFISEIIILLYLFVFLDFRKTRSYAYISLLFLVTFFTRPSGVYLSIPVLVFVIINYKLFLERKMLSFIFLTIVLLLMAKSYSFNANYLIRLANEAIQKTWIIYGYDQIEINSNPENQLMYFSEIVYKRSLYYFGMIRPYFGKMHNIVLMLFYPLYLFAIYGAFLKTKTPRKIKVFVIFVIGAFSGASILTFINWHGRFIAPIIPLILILAAIGVEKIVEQVKIAPKRS